MRLSLLSFSLFALLACSTAIYAQNPEPDCPAISVTGPAGIAQPGERFVFTGVVNGSLPKDISYRWHTSEGRIVDGQGTLKIYVEASPNAEGITLIATLAVDGLPKGCQNSASETAEFVIDPGPIQTDEFGLLSNKAIKVRLTKFFNELLNNPNGQGYIINYGTDKEVQAREKLILNTINFREFDRSRITLVRGGRHESGKVFTKLYRVPPGADNPSP